MTDDVSHDPIYQTVSADDFRAMIAPDRYAHRTRAFEDLVSATHEHFWDPLDSRYIDFSEPFDLTREAVLPLAFFPEFQVPAVQELSESARLRLANECARWMISSLLHGEQAAMSLCTNLCNMLVDPGAQEYASNQAREEARHVTAYSKYIEVRWGTPYRVGDSLGGLLTELVAAPEVYKKLVGMQILVEGLAMGMFAVVNALTLDPVLKRVTQLVMTDEAFHQKFGKTWAEKTLPHATAEEHRLVEDWAAACFEKLLLNLVNIRERREIYGPFGLDWRELRDGCERFYGADARREQLKQPGNVFRILAATLVKAGVVSERTRPIYQRWVDLDAAEGDIGNIDAIGEIIFRNGISYLREINSKRQTTLDRLEQRRALNSNTA